MSSNLVSCQWLKERLNNLGDIVIIDVSWSSAKDNTGLYEDYKKKHIPGARYINVLDAEHTPTLVRNLPTPEHFTDLAQKAGVKKTSHVVIYSNSDRAGFFMSGRGWWTFRVFGFTNVSILDGGLAKWESTPGCNVTDVVPQITRGDFQASSSKSMYKTFEDMMENLSSPKYQVVDTRDETSFSVDNIPKAANIPMGMLTDQNEKTLKKEADLREEFKKAGVDLTKSIIFHCKGGMGSCTGAFSAELLGQKDVYIFHGGFTEWSQKYPSQQAQQ